MQLGCGSTVIRHPRQTVEAVRKGFLSACDKKDVQMWRPILGYFKESSRQLKHLRTSLGSRAGRWASLMPALGR